ncbi:putative mannosyl-oligosaccharidealpha-mannosidase [Phaeomoniella chlamydospora]|uniref:alpha-1,2-Mannosidase n=1 Tax=Phaeomoniella chlamydospora TaxID=158046 RepID=A0A0G2EB41_PHACM|nr:putative mannosyl-oligosaccharidealpha-mannosidase [Phaeomoniella chlamydospora]
MSFQVPQNVPSFTSAQRPHEDGYWKAAHRNVSQNGSIGAKFNDFFSDGKDLPLYKDKPSYSSNRKRRLFQRKRTYIFGAAVVLVLFYLLRSKAPDHSLSHPFSGATGHDLFSYVEQAGPKHPKAADWELRRQSVKEAFLISWEGYEKYAWGLDEYHPISKNGRNMVAGGMGWIIVDALDTAMIMNLTSCVKHARDWISTSLHYDAHHEVNTFETTIRMLGGLLSAHYLSTTFPDLAPLTEDDVSQPGEDLYIEKATDLADRILGAFDTPSGIPFASFNLNTSTGIPSHADGGASSTAEAATTQLEFKYLAKLTGEPHYWEKVERVIEVIDSNHMPGGLLPIYIYPSTGNFRGENIRLGSRGDSYYEYLIKQYLQTSKAEPVYLEMWNEALAGVKEYLITYSEGAKLTILAERPNGLSRDISPKMDHLVCFMPGTIALGATSGRTVAQAKADGSWTAADEENMVLAKELMKTCWAMYKATPTGLAPEITYFNIDSPPKMYNDFKTKPVSSSLDGSDWRPDIDIHGNDVHNLQRPETVESLLYMWRITGDEIYRQWGWDMFRSWVKHSAYPVPVDGDASEVYAFTSLDSANIPDPDKIAAPRRDNMESFWLAETLKYFYLLFSPDELLPLDQVVINTEAHFFPRFEMGKNLKTGWQRGVSRNFEDDGSEPSQQTTVKVESVQANNPSTDTTEELIEAVRAEAMRQVGKLANGVNDQASTKDESKTSTGQETGDMYPTKLSAEENALNEAIRAEAMRQATQKDEVKAAKMGAVKENKVPSTSFESPEEAALSEAIRAEAMRQARQQKYGH